MLPRRLLPIPLLLFAAGCTPALSRAIIKGDKAKIDALLKKGVDVNAGKPHNSPIAQAVIHGDAALVERLIKKGASLRIGMSAASERGLVGMMQVFLAKGVDVNQEALSLRNQGSTYLFTATQNGHRRAVELLLGKGANPDKSHSRQGWLPLAIAAFRGHEAISRDLIKGGAEPERSASFLRMQRTGYPKINAAISAGIEMIRRLKKELADEKKRKITARATAAVRRKAIARKKAQAKRMRTDVESPSYKIPPMNGDFAIVVGIEEYRDLPKAEYADRDAELIVKHLLALGVPRRNLIHLTGSRAGYSSLKKYLESWLPKNVGPNGRVYFYFAGHGAPDPNTGEAYLMPWNGDPSFLADTAYPVSRLYRKLEALPAKEIIVALDACFSGAGGRSVLAKGARPLVTQVDTRTQRGSKLTVFAATAGNEITSTLEEVGHGIFTYFFVKGLNGAAKNTAGNITARALYDYLRPNVQDEARRQNRAQTPSLQIPLKRTLILRGN